MDQSTHRIDASKHRLWRVGRLTRRRLRLEGASLTNGIHTDGKLSVVISGLGSAAASVGETIQWWSNRPVALVTMRSAAGVDDVAFSTGPIRWGTWVRPPGDDGGISYISFSYDTEPDAVAGTRSGTSASVASILARLLKSGLPA